ncbi:endonuclease domain-containing protein [Sphingomonas soli]|uniref:endonuclease domain-containing protein n=1 Tax=Sphingomonas soli TaxID=266127 RepID=UPI00082A83A0|nr:endonuclease domain-containing protein [Sphingomonas soli]
MQTVTRARHLRRDMTLPEVLLWGELRGGKTGLKFRRQHPAGPYILDFYCASVRLAVEVDGEVHASPDQLDHDRRRDAWLASRHVHILRIPARTILNDLANALAGIVAFALPHQPLHRPPDGPPPRSGEE